MTIEIELGKVDKILAKYEGGRGILIQALLDIQSEFNWIPPEAMDRIRKKFNIPISQIYRVASFYKAMNLTPRGRHLIRVCLGTACHVQGGDFLLNALNSEIGIGPNETTEDGRFDLERVACLGCCALAPVVMIDDEIFSNMSVIKLKETLSLYE